ncbi:hexokinase-2-like isoform X2 [Panonychus citri]|uniref:hexokinase-2-like isoform X2 n=1 Tax=Panonychus citri TaxID=50023 RepID=UPI0023072242|nr:hexokinase-2-like isoform X2 [Panonychus citri]
MSHSFELSKIESITRDLVLTNDQLEKVASLLLNEFNEGLGKTTHPSASVKMFPTYVRDVPNGREEGKFLALDLGGTNFRVLLIDINGDKFQMENEIYAIPQEIMLGTGEQLFDHIASCLAQFIEKREMKTCRLPLGFTFSFPCIQEGLIRAKLVQWTKGFKCAGVEGRDVVQLLRDAIKRRSDIDIDVMAVVNDTTGTLMSCAHKNRECRVGLIVGTGTNACYMENLDNVELWNEEVDDPRQVIVNTEWGAFGDNGVLDFIRTQWDEEIDVNSLNPGKQLFEKMISGMYMGELCRVILADLTKRGLIFGGEGSSKLFTPWGFKTAYISFIESDSKHSYTETRKALEELDLTNVSNEDCEALKLVSARVSTRAAYLVSAAVATILNKIRRPHTTVGVDGSVYRYHPHFHDLMERKIADLVHPEYKFDLMLSEDGSGRGAALVAAVAVRQPTR